jgi:hypothetical protein
LNLSKPDPTFQCNDLNFGIVVQQDDSKCGEETEEGPESRGEAELGESHLEEDE